MRNAALPGGPWRFIPPAEVANRLIDKTGETYVVRVVFEDGTILTTAFDASGMSSVQVNRLLVVDVDNREFRVAPQSRV